ncbi:MAG: hypothetical protein MK095_08120 [Phycisphaerales bacterium]|nr:hypothetical protein [Phycisphaerales bacterium]
MTSSESQTPHPNSSIAPQTVHATPALVLGILSLVFAGACFIIGLILGIIGLAKARAGQRDIEHRPELGGFGMVQAGKICSIIGIVLNVLITMVWLGYLAIILIAVAVGAAAEAAGH